MLFLDVIHGPMGESTRENGSKIRCMERAYFRGLMEENTQAAM